MTKFRIFLACLACRAAKILSRVTGHGGTAMPGKVALKLCPDILGYAAKGVKTVIVTGTNGKTTACKMLSQMCAAQGVSYFSNVSGANLKSGLTAEFLAHATVFGKAKYDYAVIECDEGALHTVTAELAPAAIAVTNIFRDQLDRFGEVTQTAQYIRQGIQNAPGAVACLNADCMLTVSAGAGLSNQTLYYGIDVPLTGQTRTVSDVPRCLNCGGQYRYRYQTYAHLGAYYCPDCGMERPEAQVAVTEILELSDSRSRARMRLGDRVYDVTIAIPAIYNVYNAAAALTAAQVLGFDADKCIAALSEVSAGFGRLETLRVGEVETKIVLVKNPVGLSRALDYLCTIQTPYLAVFCLNDKVNDGTDISWIWDADFDVLAEAYQGDELVVYGTRAEDMKLRLKYAGFDEDRITLAATMDQLVERIEGSEVPVCVLPNYTAMLEVRERLAAISGEHKFWE